MLSVREGLDPRQRALLKTNYGRRVQHERRLINTPATLIVVPSSLLEHWYEQLKRHVDARVLERDGAGGAGSAIAVWIDGLGDMNSASSFQLPSKQRLMRVFLRDSKPGSGIPVGVPVFAKITSPL